MQWATVKAGVLTLCLIANMWYRLLSVWKCGSVTVFNCQIACAPFLFTPEDALYNAAMSPYLSIVSCAYTM